MSPAKEGALMGNERGREPAGAARGRGAGGVVKIRAAEDTHGGPLCNERIRN